MIQRYVPHQYISIPWEGKIAMPSRMQGSLHLYRVFGERDQALLPHFVHYLIPGLQGLLHRQTILRALAQHRFRQILSHVQANGEMGSTLSGRQTTQGSDRIVRRPQADGCLDSTHLWGAELQVALRTNHSQCHIGGEQWARQYEFMHFASPGCNANLETSWTNNVSNWSHERMLVSETHTVRTQDCCCSQYCQCKAYGIKTNIPLSICQRGVDPSVTLSAAGQQVAVTQFLDRTLGAWPSSAEKHFICQRSNKPSKWDSQYFFNG